MGASELDLSELSVTDFRLEAQTSYYTVVFPNEGRVNAVVTRGVSRTTLVIPAGVALARGRRHLIRQTGLPYRRHLYLTRV